VTLGADRLKSWIGGVLTRFWHHHSVFSPSYPNQPNRVRPLTICTSGRERAVGSVRPSGASGSEGAQREGFRKLAGYNGVEYPLSERLRSFRLESRLAPLRY
jgi:hypothetical protein